MMKCVVICCFVPKTHTNTNPFSYVATEGECFNTITPERSKDGPAISPYPSCSFDYLLSPSILFFAHLIVLHFLFHCTLLCMLADE